MLYAQQNNGIRLGLAKFLFNIAYCVTETGDPVGQKIFEFIRRNNNDTDIYMTVLKIVSYVDDVTCTQVASAGNLNFNPNSGDNGLVVTKSFDPINIS